MPHTTHAPRVRSHLRGMLALSAAQALVFAATTAAGIAMMIHVARQYGPAAAGVVAAGGGLPWLIGSGFGGQVADLLTAHGRRTLGVVLATTAIAVTAAIAVFGFTHLPDHGAGPVLYWAGVQFVLSAITTVKNSLARLALLDLDPGSTTKNWFARLDRASFQVGVSVGGLVAAVLDSRPPELCAWLLLGAAAISGAVFVAIFPPERERRHSAGVWLRLRVLPPAGLTPALRTSLGVLAVAGLFGAQQQALWPITATQLGVDGLMGWMRMAAALSGLAALTITAATPARQGALVRGGAWLLGGACALFASAQWLPLPVAVGAAVAASAGHGFAVALLLVGTRQMAAVAAPPAQVGEVTGWTSLPVNGFAVITGPLVGLASGAFGVGPVWAVSAAGVLAGTALVLHHPFGKLGT